MQGDDIAVPSVFVVSTAKRIVFSDVGESVVDRVGPARMVEEARKAKGSRSG